MPAITQNFVQATNPCLLDNQLTIAQIGLHLSKPRGSWCYICQSTGTGKSTLMLDLSYFLALDVQPKRGNTVITVRLVVMNKELIELYRNRFKDKQESAS